MSIYIYIHIYIWTYYNIYGGWKSPSARIFRRPKVVSLDSPAARQIKDASFGAK